MEEQDYFLKTEQAHVTARALEPIKWQSREGSSQPNKDLQAVEMFRRYFPEKPKQDNNGNVNPAELEAAVEKKRRLPPRALMPLIPPKFGTSMSRTPSLLEQQLLPVNRSGPLSGGDQTSAGPAAAPADNKITKSQLTIFYAGTINVYDDVSVDKAQAIMLLAGESCRPKLAKEMPRTDPRLSLALHSPNSKPEEAAAVPIARKISLTHHFLQKRYQRMRERSPYGWAPTPRKGNGVGDENSNIGVSKTESVSRSSFWLSPFPSGLGHFSSPVVSTKP